MELERTELHLIERSLAPATIRKISRSQWKNRFKISRTQKKASTQTKRKRTHRRHQATGKTTVGGQIVRKSMAPRITRQLTRKQRRTRTGEFNPRKRRADDQSFQSKMEAYEALVDYLQEYRASF